MTILGRFSYGRCIFEPDWRRSELARTSRRLQIVADSAPRRPREPALRSGLVKNKGNTSAALAGSARGSRQRSGFKHQNEAGGESAVHYAGKITSSTATAARPVGRSL